MQEETQNSTRFTKKQLEMPAVFLIFLTAKGENFRRKGVCSRDEKPEVEADERDRRRPSKGWRQRWP
jgi:hypothetical protein